MIKKMDNEEYMEKFWPEFGTNIKLGIIEDHSNRSRLAKLVRFQSSNSEDELTGLAEYMERAKEKQDFIYFMAAPTRFEVRFKKKKMCKHALKGNTKHHSTLNDHDVTLLFQGYTH